MKKTIFFTKPQAKWVRRLLIYRSQSGWNETNNIYKVIVIEKVLTP